MIAQDILVIDLDPCTWRNLGEAMRLGLRQKRTLSILHDGGRLIKVYDSKLGLREDIVVEVVDPARLAKKLYESLPGIERVQIFDKRSLIDFSLRVQRNPFDELDTDEYLNMVSEVGRREFEDGICIYPPQPEGWNFFRYAQVRKFIKEVVPDRSTLVLGVFDGGELYIGLIVGVEGRKVKLVTTFDSLVPLGLGALEGPEDYKEVLRLTARRFYEPAVGLFTDRATFEELILREEKRGVLRRALEEGRAILEPGKDLQSPPAESSLLQRGDESGAGESLHL